MSGAGDILGFQIERDKRANGGLAMHVTTSVSLASGLLLLLLADSVRQSIQRRAFVSSVPNGLDALARSSLSI